LPVIEPDAVVVEPAPVVMPERVVVDLVEDDGDSVQVAQVDEALDLVDARGELSLRDRCAGYTAL